ncbi:hypothetical protein WICMUC_001419 [Wickerhamomyces mucosus]|uniref:Kinesin-like protein n=1 Tax=Wickerhamomyces mucosus TaxID=1378264 RepID=A0A9P8PVK9_9ASCO|nr:hypothetical protein WICMUC_001419 [Wickerhamomyces mucosus]
MFSRSQTPKRGGAATPATPSMRSTSSLGPSKSQTPASMSRLQSNSRFSDRNAFTPVRERVSRPSSSLSYSSLSRPTTPSFVAPSQPYTGSIAVAIRAKPSETFLKDPWFLGDGTIHHNDVGEFKFDHVFQPTSGNLEVYEKVVQNLISQLMEGYNATVFAYGMTGSGKTYSMSGTKEEPGIIPLSIREIFEKIEESDKNVCKHELKVSYLEIYNERIYDLLNVNFLKSSSSSIASDLKIRDSTDYGVKVIGLVEETIRSEKELLKIIQKGDLNRRTSETDFNSRSSRSHAIVQLRIGITNQSTGIETFSTLSLCDLAGSERATSHNERRKEGSFINKSLLALGSVIVKLSSPQTSIGHIPYRDSKLTRILQPALSGESLVAILCTIHTGQAAFAETVNSVRFAARAKNINLTVKKHEIDMTSEKDRIIEKLKYQVENQAKEIENLKTNSQATTLDVSVLGTDSNNTHFLNDEVKTQIIQLNAENKILIERLEHYKRLTDQANAEKVVLKNDIINDILTNIPIDDSKPLMLKIEELFKKTYSEIDEYRSYTNHLEHQLKQEMQNVSKKPKYENNNSPSRSPSKSLNHSEMDSILRDQEDEIFELRNELKNKDKIIKALQSAKRVRESLISTISTNDSRRETFRLPLDDTLRSLNGEKLNHLNTKIG